MTIKVDSIAVSVFAVILVEFDKSEKSRLVYIKGEFWYKFGSHTWCCKAHPTVHKTFKPQNLKETKNLEKEIELCVVSMLKENIALTSASEPSSPSR